MVRGEIMHVSSLNKPAPCCLNTCNERLLIDLNRIPLSLVNWSSKAWVRTSGLQDDEHAFHTHNRQGRKGGD